MSKNSKRSQSRYASKNTELTKLDDGSERYQNSELKIKKITAKNESQKHYMKKINGSSVTIGIGPAGVGKTWLATVMGAQALKNGQTDKLYFTRPAVEVGETLGFLPGEMDEKYDPYLRPIKDALIDALGAGPTEYYFKSKKIEAVPMQFLRGTSLNDCWLIADEMQNSTPTEMKMLLTRFGQNAKYIINGDIRQKDIKGTSGLEDALYRLRGLDDIAICNFGRDDIVRSGLVRAVIDRYEGTEGYFNTQEELEKAIDDEGLQRFLTN